MAVADISSGKPKGGGFLGFMEKAAPFIPMVGGVVSNILGGINERKARLYNSPAQQVKRLNEAGLPLAAASNISPGGGVTNVSDLGTSNVSGQISHSVGTQVQRKQMELLNEDLRAKKAYADIQEGERDWLLSQRPNYLGSIHTNQAGMKDLDYSIKESQEVLENNKQMISGIEREVKEQLRDGGYLTNETIQRINQMLAHIGLISEQTTALSDSRKAREVLLNTMEKNGMNIFEALTYMFVTKYMGSGN